MPPGITSCVWIGGGTNARATVRIAELNDSAVIVHWAIRPHGTVECDEPCGEGDGAGAFGASLEVAWSAQCRSMASAGVDSDVTISFAITDATARAP